MQKPYLEIDDILTEYFYYECDLKRIALGLARVAVDGEGRAGRLLLDRDDESLEEVSFDVNADVQWYHIPTGSRPTSDSFGSSVLVSYDLVWATRLPVDTGPFTHLAAMGPYVQAGATSQSYQNATRWNLSAADTPNEFRFGVTSYTTSYLTNHEF